MAEISATSGARVLQGAGAITPEGISRRILRFARSWLYGGWGAEVLAALAACDNGQGVG